MRVDHEDGSGSFLRAELRCDHFFECKVGYTDQLLPSLDKGAYYSFDLNYPCWAWHYGTERDTYLVELVVAVDEAALTLSIPPNPNAKPVLPGISWLVFSDVDLPEQPDPTPMPVPPDEPEPDPQPPAPVPAPDPDWVPRTTTFVPDGVISHPKAIIWGGSDLVWVLPNDLYMSFFEETYMRMAARLREAIEAGEYTVEERKNDLVF
ncbi:MAG: hypothetical protein A2W25_11810 [candidate division Zixibacteria bacterium RBG_16_53_22]|nr:MAG: hypothetical protein A2W25_11810 [candidate division Zixibacteria bacterium RBG_16_53_22]